MDLTPAPVDAAPPRRAGRRPVVYLVLLLVVGALGVVVYQALSSASLYFYNADEAVAERDELGDRRFRLQGTVLAGVQEVDGGVQFCVAYAGARVEAHHDGDPPEMFEPGIPVVLEGRWAEAGGQVFDSDRILVKHSAQYEEENEERLEDAEERGDAAASSTDCATRPAP